MSGLPQAGDRIELVSCNDPYTKLEPGTQGTVTGVNGPLQFMGGDYQIWVDWDTGSRLGLVASQDRWRILERAGLE